MFTWGKIVLFIFINLCSVFVKAEKSGSLDNALKSVEMSEIYGMIERGQYKYFIENFSVTLFAPQNAGFQKLKAQTLKDDTLLAYHMVNVPYKVDALPPTVTSMVLENSPLFITRTENGDVYVNNAKIIKSESIVETPSKDPSKKKILHVIDEVLQPLRKNEKAAEDEEYNPNAMGLLNRSDFYSLNNYHTGIFAGRVRAMNRTENFRATGMNTYLIPVDEGIFQKKIKPEIIDEKIVDAHVIYGKALFLNPTPENRMYETAAFSDSVKVVVSFASDTYYGIKKRYVRSNTVVGDYTHPKGAVLTEIVYPNIPVRNGVVHLIQKPLMIIDKTVQQFLDESTESLISIFKEKLQYAGDAFRHKLSSQQGITLFIPSNNAWKDLNVEKTLANNTSFLQNILDLHLVSEKLSLSTIRERGSREVATLWKKKYLYFNLIIQGNNQTLTIEGGGVNATVLHPDIGASNGVIHIIDRVLGIPYATVGRKVATDPTLNFTYNLGNIPYKIGKYRNFNDRLDDTSKNFTYFVPRDAAWKLFSIQHPQLYNALWKPGYANQILERHLIEDRNFTMIDLKRTLNDTYLLQTQNGGLNIQVNDDNKGVGYSIWWNNEWVAVYRPDVRCTNGIIHVIDKVLITPNDIKIPVGGALKNVISFPALLLFVLPLGLMIFYH